MRLEKYMVSEGNDIVGVIKDLSSMPYRKLEQFLRDRFKEFMDNIPSGIDTPVVKLINKAFGTNYRFLQDIYDEKVPPLRESVTINEDLAHWWDTVKSEGFPTLSFYPALTAWLEIDKYLRGQDINIRVLVIYSMFWLLLVSGKYIKGWIEWKKRNPEEYNKERQQGKGGII